MIYYVDMSCVIYSFYSEMCKLVYVTTGMACDSGIRAGVQCIRSGRRKYQCHMVLAAPTDIQPYCSSRDSCMPPASRYDHILSVFLHTEWWVYLSNFSSLLSPDVPHQWLARSRIFLFLIGKEEDSHRQQGTLRESSSPLRCFEQWGSLDQIKPAYDRRRPDGLLN